MSSAFYIMPGFLYSKPSEENCEVLFELQVKLVFE
jgi:hypothetical protein